MRWEPPQPKPPEGGNMLSGQLDAQWANLRNMTNLKRTPILGDEALRKAAAIQAHRHAQQLVGGLCTGMAQPPPVRPSSRPAA